MAYRSRWKPEDKVRIVMESLNTSISIAELCRKHGVVPITFYQWKEKFLEAGKLGLSGGLRNHRAASDAVLENERLNKLIGGADHRQRFFKESAGGKQKMTAVRLMLEDGQMSLRKALLHSGMSRAACYYRPVPRVIRPDDALVVGKVEELALKRPSCGTRRMAAQLSRELHVPINRKRVQRVFRALNWTQPARTKSQI